MNMINEQQRIAESRDSRVNYIIESNRSWRSKYRALMGMLEGSDPKKAELAKTTLMIMQNQADFMERIHQNPQLEATFVQNLGALVPRVIDLVRIFYPNLVSQELVDIQPMDRQNGEVFIVEPKFSNTASGVNAGDTVFKDLTNGTYAGVRQMVTMAPAPDGVATAFTGTAAGPFPLVPGSVVIQAVDVATDPPTVINGTDDGAGNLVGQGLGASTVDYATGAITLALTAAPATGSSVMATFKYDYENQGDQIRELEIQLSLFPVTAEPHPLRVKWSTQAQLAASSHLDLDIPDILTNLVASFIKQERDILLINGINAVATPDVNLNFDASHVGTPDGPYYSKLAKYAEIELKLNYAESITQRVNGRGGVSWILAGNNATDIWRNASSFVPSGVVAPIGPHVVGSLRDGTVSLIKVPSFDPNTYITGFKGYVVGDAATILAEWIPLYASPVFQAPDLNQYQGMMSLYRIVQNNISYYRKGEVSGYAA